MNQDFANKLQEFTVVYGTEDFEKLLCERYRKYGVVVITGVHSEEYCNQKMDEIVQVFENLGTGIDRNKLEETWTTYNLPPQTRPGMYQALLANIQPVIDVRCHSKAKHIFQTLYNDLRENPVTDLVPTPDGINIKPNGVGPYNKLKSRDWPHLDQTIRNPFLCVQGQTVLTETSAAFRCTPKSHLLHSQIMDILEEIHKNLNPKSNWVKFDNNEINLIRDLCKAEDIDWQIPIYSPKGSFIIWNSTTIHSAKLADGPEEKDPNDFWKGWRGVVYTCWRPKSEIPLRAQKLRKKYLEENRCTNHWGNKVFSKTPGGRYLYIEQRHPEIEKFLKIPSTVYNSIGYPDFPEELI